MNYSQRQQDFGGNVEGGYSSFTGQYMPVQPGQGQQGPYLNPSRPTRHLVGQPISGPTNHQYIPSNQMAVNPQFWELDQPNPPSTTESQRSVEIESLQRDVRQILDMMKILSEKLTNQMDFLRNLSQSKEADKNNLIKDGFSKLHEIAQQNSTQG